MFPVEQQEMRKGFIFKYVNDQIKIPGEVLQSLPWNRLQRISRHFHQPTTNVMCVCDVECDKECNVECECNVV